WYYHAEANACRPFVFGGCRGNSNRFETKWKCERRCKTSAGKAAPEPSNPPLPPSKKHYALLWYYHAEANACRPFVFGGCRGNSNRFETKWKCERRC
ncbi:Papilin, partial [Fulmarus glacialis]